MMVIFFIFGLVFLFLGCEAIYTGRAVYTTRDWTFDLKVIHLKGVKARLFGAFMAVIGVTFFIVALLLN